jgi:hypothetical protein
MVTGECFVDGVKKTISSCINNNSIKWLYRINQLRIYSCALYS